VEPPGVAYVQKMKDLGFDVLNGDTSIIPVMLYDEYIAVEIVENLYENGIYVVPKGKARIRVQRYLQNIQ